MPKLSPINATKLIKILNKQGFVLIRQSGSHARLEHLDSRKPAYQFIQEKTSELGYLEKYLEM